MATDTIEIQGDRAGVWHLSCLEWPAHTRISPSTLATLFPTVKLKGGHIYFRLGNGTAVYRIDRHDWVRDLYETTCVYSEMW